MTTGKHCKVSKLWPWSRRLVLKMPNRVSKRVVSTHVSSIPQRRDFALNFASVCADRQADLHAPESPGAPLQAAWNREQALNLRT